MTFTLSLPTEAERALRERARAAGQEVGTYLEQMIVRELAAPLTIAEAAEPIARAVDASGATDEEFTEAVIAARDAARRARRSGAA